MTESQATEVNSVLLAARNLVIGLTSDESPPAAIRWCKELTAAGGEGMVVKPLEWIQRALRGLVQPAVKCRGREYSSTEITGQRFSRFFSHEDTLTGRPEHARIGHNPRITGRISAPIQGTSDEQFQHSLTVCG